jgi:hypothetical protein
MARLSIVVKGKTLEYTIGRKYMAIWAPDGTTLLTKIPRMWRDIFVSLMTSEQKGKHANLLDSRAKVRRRT